MSNETLRQFKKKKIQVVSDSWAVKIAKSLKRKWCICVLEEGGEPGDEPSIEELVKVIQRAATYTMFVEEG